MNKFIKKLGSRKWWLAIAGIATGVAMAFGVESSDISTVAGAVTALVSAVTYIVVEGKVDAEAVKKAVEATQGAVEVVSKEG